MLISQHFLSNNSVISCHGIRGFFYFGGERGGFQMTAKDNGFGDKNVSLNKQIVTAEMEDGEERLLFCKDKQHVCLLLVYF
jgi:hypothetical protein